MHSIAIIYLAIILFLVYKNGFFGLFNDGQVSTTRFALLFFFKALAIVAFWLVYSKFYGGLEQYDAGVFYNDAKAVNALAYINPLEYIKLLLGLQDDSEGSYVYEHCLVNTYNWDNGKIRDFFYNDNRVVIRVHALLHFIAFNSYFVHALFNCFLSFIGLTLIYRSLKEFFPGRELALLLILCFFPTLWFYTGALLKEGLAVFVLGGLIYCLKKIIYKHGTVKTVVSLLLLLFISCFLKPYLLCLAAVCFTLFFVIHRYQARRKLLLFSAAFFMFIFSANILSLLVKGKSLSDAVFARQRVFADAARGGIFLLDSVKFVRLEFDSALVKRAGAKQYTIRKDVPYIYWEHTHQEDTLFCDANTDTSTRYQLVYQRGKSGSNLDLNAYSGNITKTAGAAFYNSLFYPLFINADGPLQWVASLENLLIVLSLLLILLGFIRNRKDYFPAFAFVFFALCICLLVGLTTPNSGAIFRYRSPAIIFLLAAALYCTRLVKTKNSN